MAASAGTVTLELDANSVKLLRELNKTQRQTKKTANSMRKSMTNSFNAIRNAAIVAFGARTLKGIADAGLAMERMERSLKFVTGSTEAAGREMKFLRDISVQLGLDLQSAGTAYTKLSAAAKGTVLQGQAVRDIFTSVSKASVVMGLTADQTEGALRALEQMISKGTVQAEELRGQLGERLPGAFQIAAKAMGKTTQELGKMLENGEVLASDLLPALSSELNHLFDSEVDEAANSAQAAFARLSTAAFELKASIADSGLLDALAEMANFTTFLLRDGKGTGPDAEINEQLLELQAAVRRYEVLVAQAEKIKDSPGGFGSARMTTAEGMRRLNEYRETLAKLRKELASMDTEALKIATGTQSIRKSPNAAILSFEKSRKELLDFIQAQDDALQKSADKFAKSFETAEQEVARRLQEFSLVEHLFPDDERERIKTAIKSVLTDGIDEIELEIRPMSEKIKKLFEVEMPESAKQAARNIQDAFAEFLFDPFDKGIKGMLEGFLTAIRRMMANNLARDLFGEGSAFSGFFKNIFGGGKAMGGPVSGGTSYLVGEEGPELFTPGASGVITPNHKLTGSGVVVQQNYHIEAGADWATLSKVLPPMFEDNQRATIAQLTQMKMEGAF